MSPVQLAGSWNLRRRVADDQKYLQNHSQIRYFLHGLVLLSPILDKYEFMIFLEFKMFGENFLM